MRLIIILICTAIGAVLGNVFGDHIIDEITHLYLDMWFGGFLGFVVGSFVAAGIPEEIADIGYSLDFDDFDGDD